MPITNETLAIYATKAMHSPGRYPKTDDLFEDLDKAERMWDKWKELYTKADRKAVVKRIAARNLEQFGGASTGGHAIDRTNRNGRAEPPPGRPVPVTLDDLEGCFDSLAGAEGAKVPTLDELVKTNAALMKSISTLTDTNAKLSQK